MQPSPPSGGAAGGKIGHLIPEFPGQTHILFWREILALRAWGVPLRIISTRTPPQRDRARHAWAQAAQDETFYLWPMGTGEIAAALAWGLLHHPIGVLRCIRLGLTLPVDPPKGKKKKQRVLPLLLPALKLARQVRAEGITHLHAHTCAAGAILGIMVKRLTGTPYSMTLHANIEWWGGAMKEKFEDAAFTLIITDKLMRQMDEQFPTLRPDQKLIGRMGCDTRRWTPDPNLPGSDTLRIFSLSRLHHSKGHPTLLAALARLKAQGLAFTFRIAGDGPQRGELETLVRNLGLAAEVTFLGSLGEDDAIAQMRQSDLFVLASLAEPLGVVYMEAMSTAVATIGTRAGGVAEIITDGHDGLLVPPQDEDALAAAIGLLAEDPARRRRIAAAGRATIVDRFDSRVGAGVLYRRVFGQAPPGE